MNKKHAQFMKEALKMAEEALEAGEWPVGAVIVYENEIIAKASNKMENLGDPTAHAEILVAQQASEHLQTKFLSGCDLYVTLQPCKMCFYTLKTYRIRSIIYGAKNSFVEQPDPSCFDCICEKEAEELLKKHAKNIRLDK